MNKQERDYIKQGVKTLPTDVIQDCILVGISSLTFASMMKDRNKFNAIGKELYLLEQELKQRGLKMMKQKIDQGLKISIVPYVKVDTKRNSPITMSIPSITELLSMPLPTDLPPHGYLTIYLP